MDDLKKPNFLALLIANKGRVFGIATGFLVGIVSAIWGIWEGLFLLLCLILGNYIGKYFDNKHSLKEVIERIFPSSD
ncbi:MAG TPA: hypothetical protein DHD79_07670 [Firmicutes bacterium]|nr:hypothetical protein [Bacillota bacterium]HAW71929.1 hypothetical protein [Bacillota bacterium]HAZ22542.1 hypothetical protein [Bacillota bacterium]HBE06258.1 hypothetical protein [Bacillota bacterium]HBG43460.1 hypothetical protein [Bacillota bacterium]